MEEISLKEIIEILLRGKKLILLTTLVFIALSLVFGLAQPKLFTSEAVLNVNPININPTISNDGSSIIGDIAAIAQFPVMDINSYTQQLTSNKVLEYTINELDLRDKNGDLFQPEALKNKIEVKSDEKTNIIYVTARDRNAQSAADITNTLVDRFIVYLTETINSSCTDALENIKKQLNAQKEKINIETTKLKAYSESPYNVRELESSIVSLISQITRYKSDLNDMQRSTQADKMAIAAMNDAGIGVSAEEFKISIPSGTYAGNSVTDADEAVLAAGSGPAVEITVDGSSDVENAVLAVKKAELGARLVQNEADYNSLLIRLAEMESSLSLMQSILAEEQQKYSILERDYRLAGEIYGKYQNIYQQIPIIASSNLAMKNIQVLSPAAPSGSADNESIFVYMTIGMVLGLFVGTFVVLFRNYWVKI